MATFFTLTFNSTLYYSTTPMAMFFHDINTSVASDVLLKLCYSKFYIQFQKNIFSFCSKATDNIHFTD